MNVIVLALAFGPAVTPWPEIQPTARSWSFPNAAEAAADLEVRDRAGRVVYKLMCRPGGYESKLHDFTGEFDCKFFSVAGIGRDDWPPQLLISDPGDSEYYSRARFLRGEIAPACHFFLRQFRLRGMRLTLHLKNVVLLPEPPQRLSWKPTTLRSFDFSASVEPDPGASASISGVVEAPTCPRP